ncbi:hypothetical protein DPMN_144750 [Dreissena polymorpha]|uniref:Uncharacterized protein n=1 Tax=Dreissena polymorpha TaxID=45954 RepID=A0A9D4F8K7_DREPO|nr:hypothetical protein DPMN_144750 [Dreissena polymorpha]
MESINETKVKNNLWKRLSRGVGTEHVSALAARFRKLFSDLAACVRPARSTFPDGDTKSPTKGGESNTNPIFRGPQITVPWTSPVFAYHTSGYITNAEVNAQVKLLELRFRKQSEILSRHEHRTSVLHKISATLIPYFNDEKVAEMADLVEKIKLRRFSSKSGPGEAKYRNMYSIVFDCQQGYFMLSVHRLVTFTPLANVKFKKLEGTIELYRYATLHIKQRTLTQTLTLNT